LHTCNISDLCKHIYYASYITTLTPIIAMSISGLANIATPNIPLPSQPISAATTRILTLSNFSPAIKTKDLHQAFQPWAEDKGGYKIKWIDDVTALAVFNDATVGA
jgi:hypothetical protein